MDATEDRGMIKIQIYDSGTGPGMSKGKLNRMSGKQGDLYWINGYVHSRESGNMQAEVWIKKNKSTQFGVIFNGRNKTAPRPTNFKSEDLQSVKTGTVITIRLPIAPINGNGSANGAKSVPAKAAPASCL